MAFFSNIEWGGGRRGGVSANEVIKKQNTGNLRTQKMISH